MSAKHTTYPHMCRDGHAEIGHSDNEHEMCPLCRAVADRDELLKALKEVQWSDGGRCPQCGRFPETKHQPRCVVGNAIAHAEGGQS